ENTTFWRYLYDRELDSLVGDNAQPLINFLLWMQLGQTTHNGITGLNVRSYREFTRKIKPSLDRGAPVPLGIVKVKGGGIPALFDNHQVLAVGYFYRAGEAVLAIYDPNFPALSSPSGNDDGDGITYMFTRQRVQTYDSEGQHQVDFHPTFRGYFKMPFKFKRPPQPPWPLTRGPA
nr:hypothetical protein [Actinomycetota bacterium]